MLPTDRRTEMRRSVGNALAFSPFSAFTAPAQSHVTGPFALFGRSFFCFRHRMSAKKLFISFSISSRRVCVCLCLSVCCLSVFLSVSLLSFYLPVCLSAVLLSSCLSVSRSLSHSLSRSLYLRRSENSVCAPLKKWKSQTKPLKKESLGFSCNAADNDGQMYEI